MKKIKKILMLSFAAALAVSCTGILSACDGDESETGAVSALIGRFENSGNMEVTLTDDPAHVSDDGVQYIYTSDIYPLDTVSGETATYYYAQSLRLKRDYTYEYTCTVQLRKVMQTGNTDLAKIEIETEGTFEYASAGGIAYAVTMSDPVSGTENFYGASIVGEGNIYSWKISSAPDCVVDLATALAASQGEYVFDRYTAGRSVNVEKNEQNVLYDDAYYPDMLVDLAPYYSYSGTESGDDSATPLPPEPEPELPAEPSVPTATLPYDGDAQSGIGLAVALGEEPLVRIRVPDAVDTVTVGGAVLTEYQTEGTDNIFSYPLSYAELADTFTVRAQEKTRSFSPLALLEKFIDAAPEFTGEQSQLDGIADQRAAISILNYAALCGADVSLDGEDAALVYDSLGANIYHSDFGARDNLSLGGTADAGFVWGGVPVLTNENGACLTYTFSVPADAQYGALTATALIGGRTYGCAVKEIGKTETERTFSFTAGPFAPLDFADTVAVYVESDGKIISGTAGYSVNRAIAKSDLSANEEERTLAKALYSLGKTAAWVAYREDISYELQPAVGNGYGYFAFSVSEYEYSFSFTDNAVSFDNSSSALYIGGTIVGGTNAQVSNERFDAQKSGNDFTVTLKGGSIDGIAPANNQTFGTITLIVQEDTVIENIMIPMWGVTAERASVIAPCNLVIRGETGVTLTIKGNIRAKDLTVEGVSVNVEMLSSSTGVYADALTVVNGELNVGYAGNVPSDASGIVAAGDVLLGGKLSVEGFSNGLWLSGDGNQRVEVAENGNLYIVAKTYGITGSAPEIGGAPVNRQLTFGGGESYIRAGSGIRYADISVGDATLTVIADSGYTVESEDPSRPVAFATTSGSEKAGKVTLVNNFYNEWWDVNYTLKADRIELNGGNVYIFGMCKNGVVELYTGGRMTVRNCDLTVESGQDLAKSYGRGINGGNGDEVITVENSAKVVFKNCDAAISCWGKAETAVSYAKLVNRGLIILDGYKLSLEPWELTSWSNNLTVDNSGQIRYTNKAEG